ncbi:MAG: LamG-like jellyroll fold domain-containing protein, partial [Planctomycetota bacterium]
VPSGDVTLRFGEDVGTVRLYNNLVASSGGTNSSTLTKTDLGLDRSQVTVPLDDRVVLVSIGGVTGDPQAVAHWDFDHVNSVLTSLDRTGNDHTLDHVGDFRKTGNGYSTMRGYGLGLTADGHGKAGNILNTSQSFTASAWVRLDDTSGSDTAISAVGNHRSAFDLGVVSGQFRFRVFAADTSPVTQAEARASFNYAQDTWYHLTGVYDASADTAKLYIDGALVDTVAVPAGVFNANAATYVGASGTGTNPTKELDGILDEVMLYQEALDADEVAALSGGRLDPRASWTVTASNSKAGNGPANTIDGVLNNRWHSGIGQYDGMWLQLNRGSDDRPFNRIVLETGVPVSDPDNQGKIDDFAKSYSVYTSDNGTDWSSQPAQTSATQSRLVTEHVGSSQMHIWLPEATTAQYVRIEADSASSKWWAVNELELHGGPVGTDIVADLTPDANGRLFAEAEDYNADASRLSQSGDTWSQKSGGSDGYHMEVGPDNGDLNDSESGTKANSPRLSWIADFDEPGRYYVWLRGKAGGSTKGTSDSAHATVDGATFSTSDRMSDFATSFGWRSSTMDSARSFIDIDAPGFARFDVYMREDGFDLDAVLLTTDSTYTPAEPAPVPNSTTQAEGATRAAAPIQDEHAGFNGSGYVNLGASGSSVEFEPDGGGGGLARLTFRFANGSTANRT